MRELTKFYLFRGSGGYPNEVGQAGSQAETWTCDHCTFINGGNLNICEMCGLPMLVFLFNSNAET